MLSASVDTTELARAMATYQVITGKTAGDVVQKQSRKLAFELSRRLRKLAPAKGEVRAERLAAMADGEGLRIRDAIRRKVRARRNRQQALVKRELSARESARGFLGYSVIIKAVKTHAIRRGRTGAALSLARFQQPRKADAAMILEWGPQFSSLSGQAAEGINQAAGQAALRDAVDAVVRDIRHYTNRKLAEAYRRGRP